MTEDLTFEAARTRLEEIIDRVKNREADLDESIELLEEGVRMANLCTEKLAEDAALTAADDESRESAADDPEAKAGEEGSGEAVGD